MDLISRQAAIELAMQYCPDDDGTCSKADEDIRNLLDELEDLPSAQPEIIRCKDCKHFIRDITCVEGHYDGCDEWTDNGNEIMVAEDDFCSYAERRTDDEG